MREKRRRMKNKGCNKYTRLPAYKGEKKGVHKSRAPDRQGFRFL